MRQLMGSQGVEIHSLCDVLEIEVAVIAKDEPCKGDEQFCEWWVNVHKVRGLDVSRRKLSKVDFIETKCEQ